MSRPSTKTMVEREEIWAMQEHLKVLKKWFGAPQRRKSKLAKAVEQIDVLLQKIGKREPVEAIAVELDGLVRKFSSEFEETREAIFDVQRAVERR